MIDKKKLSNEEQLIESRRDKAARLRSAGQNPFDNNCCKPVALRLVRAFCSCAQVEGTEDRYDPNDVLFAADVTFNIAGRIIFMRRIGGATFIRLRDQSGELQVYCEEKTLQSYQLLDELDLGDIIHVHGPLMVTIKGELSINASEFKILTKSYRPLPTKTALKDVETRYRQRYVDLISNPEVADVFRARAAIIRSIRETLNSWKFLEVETPTMQQIPGGAFAKPFATHHNALDLDLYMRVAPELYLKRLVVGGFDRVYEIGRNYRNEGISTRHNPEFTMLEYYQAYSSLNDIIQQTKNMLRLADRALGETITPKIYDAWVAARTFTLDQYVVIPMREAIEKACCSVLPYDIAQKIHLPEAPIKEWAKLAKENGREIEWSNWRKAAQKAESPGERMFLAYEYLAEPFLTRDYRTEDGSKSLPVFITRYPVEVSPLARQFDDDLSFTDRFELFIDGRELCNAFAELNDPDEQAFRFKEQAAKKSGGNEEAMQYDQDYIRALEFGLPPTCGFGAGVDRMVMLLTNSKSIRDVILFPLMRPE